MACAHYRDYRGMASEAAQAEQVKEAEEQVKEAEETESPPHESTDKSLPITKKGGGILGALFGWRGAADEVKGTHMLQAQLHVPHVCASYSPPHTKNIIIVEDKKNNIVIL
jgi:hypothetical protein